MNFPQCPKFSRPPCRSYEALADSATVCYSQILHLGRCKITMTACSIECYMLLLSKFDSVWLWLGLWIEPMDLSDESCCLMDGLDGVVGVVPMWLMREHKMSECGFMDGFRIMQKPRCHAHQIAQ